MRENELLPDDEGGGKRFEITELYGPENKRGLLIKDRMYPEDYKVTLVPDGSDIQVFGYKDDAMQYVESSGFIVPTEMHLAYMKTGIDLFETYGEKTYAQWINDGEVNRRKHVHPEPPADMSDTALVKKFITAHSMTMTVEESLEAISKLSAISDSLDRLSASPFSMRGMSSSLFGSPFSRIDELKHLLED